VNKGKKQEVKQNTTKENQISYRSPNLNLAKKRKNNTSLCNLSLGSVKFETDNFTPSALNILARFITDCSNKDHSDGQNTKR
jgi:hypothetical protein